LPDPSVPPPTSIPPLSESGDSNGAGSASEEIPSRPAYSSTSRLNEWLRALVSYGGSDLLLVPGAPACIRFEGEIRNFEEPPLEGADIEAAVIPALTPHALELYRRTRIGDSSYRVDGMGRFRINLHHQRGTAAAAIRALPSQVPTIREIELPLSVESLAHLRRGLVLVEARPARGSPPRWRL